MSGEKRESEKRPVREVKQGKASARRKTGGRGSVKMSEAAGRALELNSEEIAATLLKSTLEGNVNSAKLLFALAEGQTSAEEQEKKAEKKNRSVAEMLGMEPEWKEEVKTAEEKASE